jgi:SHS2 domain-containing protein
VTRGHRQLEHTADIALELWAPTEAELLVEGARAVIELLTEGESAGERDELPVTLEAVDPEDRLVRWLNEVLVLAVTRGFLTGGAALELIGGTALRGVLRGEAHAAHRVRAELKSATYHDLELTRDARGYRARVVIDV